jgi:hypothetical protein
MLRLRFADRAERAPRAPVPDTADVHIWYNRQGGVVAYGFQRDDAHWMYWPDLATFGFASRDSYITAFPEPRGSTSAIWDIYRRTVLPMALQANGFEALHASAVVAPSGLVAFCATSETGKSTIAFGLHRRGFPQWSDDGVVFRTDGAVATAEPLPFEVRLRAASRDIFGANAPVSTRFQNNGPGDQVHTEPAPLSAICLLSRVDGASFTGPARIRRVGPAAAFPAVLTHAHTFNPFDAVRRERMLRAYLDLLAGVSVFSVEFAPIGESFDSLLDAVADAVGLGEPVPELSSCVP